MSRQQRLESVLSQALATEHLEVIDESHQHSRGLETHYKIVLVSPVFEGLRTVARHQKIYALVQKEMESGLHALTMHLFTPAEWQQGGSVTDSPSCRGGSKWDK